MKQNIHFEGGPEEIGKKIGRGLMSYHVFQKETINLCSQQKYKKEKKIKSKSKSKK